MQEWFEEWFDSPYYHILYKNRSDDEAQQFVENIVSHFQLGPTTTLLDVACGKGRHSIAFSSYGIDVTGIDLSKNSIDFAKQAENDKLHFFVHDMRDPFRTNYFDIVCNLFTSFGYFKTDEDNRLAAASMYESVKDKGSLLIDFVNRNFAVQNISVNEEESKTIDNIHFEIRRSYNDKRLIKQINIRDGEKKFRFEECLNSFSLEEMTALFTSVGFTLQTVFGNYLFEQYDEANSPRMILVFTK